MKRKNHNNGDNKINNGIVHYLKHSERKGYPKANFIFNILSVV